MDSDPEIFTFFTYFSEDALKKQDGKKVPLTLYPGGPVIGEAELKYVPGEGIDAELRVDDPKIAEALKADDNLSIGTSRIFRKEN